MLSEWVLKAGRPGKYGSVSEVADTGSGIPEDKKHMIFKRFAQVDAAATRKYGGTGLGLYVRGVR